MIARSVVSTIALGASFGSTAKGANHLASDLARMPLDPVSSPFSFASATSAPENSARRRSRH
jgi:hypothetical protein